MSLDELQALLPPVASVNGAGATEAELVDHLTAMERLKAGLAAGQARVTATLAATRSRAEAARGVPAAKRCRGLSAEIALARREAPFRGGRHYGMSTALVHEMPDTHAAPTLLGGDHEAARLAGFGPIPAFLARDIVRNADRAWIRRLYTTPDKSTLVAMDSTRRPFAGRLREYLITRDDVCRNPFCDAPIRHADHVVPVADGGATTAENGQGLCEACNYAKETPAWHAQPLPGQPHTVEITTPTGHRYQSRALTPPGYRVDIFIRAA